MNSFPAPSEDPLQLMREMPGDHPGVPAEKEEDPGEGFVPASRRGNRSTDPPGLAVLPEKPMGLQTGHGFDLIPDSGKEIRRMRTRSPGKYRSFLYRPGSMKNTIWHPGDAPGRARQGLSPSQTRRSPRIPSHRTPVPRRGSWMGGGRRFRTRNSGRPSANCYTSACRRRGYVRYRRRGSAYGNRVTSPAGRRGISFRSDRTSSSRFVIRLLMDLPFDLPEAV